MVTCYALLSERMQSEATQRLILVPDPHVHRLKEGLVTFYEFPGLTGYVNCVQLCKSHVLKHCSLISMDALLTIHVYRSWHWSQSAF